MDIVRIIIPELIVLSTACVLFLLGMSGSLSVRKAVPVIALAGLLVAFGWQLKTVLDGVPPMTLADDANTLRLTGFGHYIKMLVAGVGALFVLMSWPTNRFATGNDSLSWDFDAGEYFSLVLCALAGVMLVSTSNDMLLLFMGIELASIPTYILVSMSRPLASAQEAGVKYFFLGAVSAAIMLFGFSYLYGTTGSTDFYEIARGFAATITTPGDAAALNAWQMLAFVMLILGFAFKLAAVPTHFYAADVYHGAATPITALLSFVPKITGVIALIKVLWVAGGGLGGVPEQIAHLLWWLAVLTMTVGNVLGLLQHNVKRVLAYSSIAHSGYLLVGLTAYVWTGGLTTNATRTSALEGVLFYLAAYGIMNVGAFGVLMMLPTRQKIVGPTGTDVAPPATTAETFDDLRGTGRANPVLGLAMAVSCFSLIGLPLTVGFLGKFFIIRPAFEAGLYSLVVITMINAAISAAYYLRIVGTMFLQDPDADAATLRMPTRSLPLTIATAVSVVGSLLFGAVPPAIQVLSDQTVSAALIETGTMMPNTPADDEDATPDDAPAVSRAE